MPWWPFPDSHGCSSGEVQAYRFSLDRARRTEDGCFVAPFFQTDLQVRRAIKDDGRAVSAIKPDLQVCRPNDVEKLANSVVALEPPDERCSQIEGAPPASEEPAQEQPDEAIEQVDDTSNDEDWESIGATTPLNYLPCVQGDVADGPLDIKPPCWFDNDRSERTKDATRRPKSTEYDAFDEITFGSRLTPPTVKEQRRRSVLSTELLSDEQQVSSFARGAAGPQVIEGMPSLLLRNRRDEPYLRRVSSVTNLPALGKEQGKRFRRDSGRVPYGEGDFDFGGEVRVF